ncbi:HutD family protein [Streptomyces sp. NPDC057287]|uniref:HutD/Ves family protein n=1 Tax=Streptomyces sp. NPDC057287 TaxID=3346086 RepID=UPI0036347F02
MTPQILRAEDRVPTPWSNGGGVTSEVAVHPMGAATDDFAWRVSVADVERGGPFSAFPGVDRIITVVDGPGVTLTVDGAPHTMDAPYEPFVLSGDAVTECRLLDGPVVAFNVMARRAEMTARVRVVRSGTAVSPAAGTRVLAIVLDGSAVLERASVRLGRLDAVLLPDGHGESFGVEGVLALVDLVARPGG